MTPGHYLQLAVASWRVQERGTANSRSCHAHALEVADVKKLAGGCSVPAFGYIQGYPRVSGCRCFWRQGSSDT